MTAAVSPPGRASAVAAPEDLDAVPMAAARGVCRRFPSGRTVGPIDLEVAGGEVLALMGANGAGKSTLLRLLATADRPDSGHVSWRDAGSPVKARRWIGYAADDPAEEVTLSIRQSTHFWCRQWVRDRGRARQMVETSLDALGLIERADEPVASLSYGLRRRLGIAQALVHAPRLALLDEPSAGLDPEALELVGALLRARSASGASTVVASNDPNFVASVADRVALLHLGRCLRVAPIQTLLDEVPHRRIVELRLGRPVSPSLFAEVPGVRLLDLTETAATLELRTDAALARLVVAVDRGGDGLRGLDVRRADLRDSFRGLIASAPEAR